MNIQVFIIKIFKYHTKLYIKLKWSTDKKVFGKKLTTCYQQSVNYKGIIPKDLLQ